MAGLKNTLAEIPAGSTRRAYGTAHYDGQRWRANVGGKLLESRWNPSVRPAQGLPIAVDITNDGQGQSTALVICAYRDQPQPPTGEIMAVGVSDLVFAGDDGGTYTTSRFLGAIGDYSINDAVYLNWDAETPMVMGVIADITVVPPAATPPAPAAPVTGTTTLIATTSDTYGVGGWGRWALSQRGGENIYSGFWAGYTLTGSWFYGAPRPELAGKTCTAVRVRLPRRLQAGNYNQPATVNIYAHTSPSRPGGDVSRVAGPHTITVNPHAGPQTVNLPTDFGPIIAAGGGISIAGGDYVWFETRLEDPESGKLDMDWKA